MGEKKSYLHAMKQTLYDKQFLCTLIIIQHVYSYRQKVLDVLLAAKNVTFGFSTKLLN